MFNKTRKLDDFLVQSLNIITKEFIEYKETFTSSIDGLDEEIKEDYDKIIETLSRITPKIKCIDDLGYLNEDDIDFVYQCLAMYESIFTIDYRNKTQQKIDEKNYKLLNRLLNLFY